MDNDRQQRATYYSSSREVHHPPFNFETVPAWHLANTGVDFLKRHYVLTCLWVLGMLIATFAKGHTVDMATRSEYNRAKHNAMEIESTALQQAQQSMAATYQKYYQSKGWFSCDPHCQRNYEHYLTASQEFEMIKSEYNAAMRDAKKIVGIWSIYGVEETRNQFWKCWEQGKDFAKRMSMYDTFFMVFDSRDESFWVFLARIIIQALINFTIGFITACIQFIWTLWFIIREYGGGWSGILFFILGTIASCSLVFSMIIAMYATTAVGAGIAISYASNRAIGGSNRQNQHLHYHAE